MALLGYPIVDEIYHQALKLLRRKDYTASQLRRKLESKFGDVPDDVIVRLEARHFLDDRRFAENFASRSGDTHPGLVREQLRQFGVSDEIIDAVVVSARGPSLRNVLEAKMADWRISPPIGKRDAGRLFRAMVRLGYPEDDIREELERLHEQ